MNNQIIIIDYGLGNLASVANAFEKLAIPNQITNDKDVIKNAKALILPGVGAAGQGMKNLQKNGLDKIIINEVKNGKPILGLCLGMQLLLTTSEEGNVTCLNLIPGKVKRLKTKLKIPQIGWNAMTKPSSVIARRNDEAISTRKRLPRSLSVARNDKTVLLKNISDKSYFYFVNSYICIPDDKKIIAGITEYGENFCSVFEKDNMFGVQFHPEKSGEVGLQLLKNFYSLSS